MLALALAANDSVPLIQCLTTSVMKKAAAVAALVSVGQTKQHSQRATESPGERSSSTPLEGTKARCCDLQAGKLSR